MTDNDDMFGHLLTYQQTEEFRRELEVAPRSARVPEKNRNHQRHYRQVYPNAVRLRREAAAYKPELFVRQNGMCYWCNKPLNDDYQVDHILAVTKGGTSDPANLCVCHKLCNAKKGVKTLKLNTRK